MQNTKISHNYFFFFSIVIAALDVLLVSMSKNFGWENILWLLISAGLLYFVKSEKIKNFFRHKLDSKETDYILQEFTLKFIDLFSVKIILDILTRLMQNYIFYVNILEIVVMILMAYLIGKYAFKFGRKKIYWIFGLLGFIWFFTFGIILGYLSILELKTEKDEGQI